MNTAPLTAKTAPLTHKMVKINEDVQITNCLPNDNIKEKTKQNDLQVSSSVKIDQSLQISLLNILHDSPSENSKGSDSDGKLYPIDKASLDIPKYNEEKCASKTANKCNEAVTNRCEDCTSTINVKHNSCPCIYPKLDPGLVQRSKSTKAGLRLRSNNTPLRPLEAHRKHSIHSNRALFAKITKAQNEMYNKMHSRKKTFRNKSLELLTWNNDYGVNSQEFELMLAKDTSRLLEPNVEQVCDDRENDRTPLLVPPGGRSCQQHRRARRRNSDPETLV